jgi:6-phosphogluconolactonase
MTNSLFLPALRLSFLTAVALGAALFAGLDSASADSDSRESTVYTLTNAAAGNEVALFEPAENGTLVASGTVGTGGLGTGSGLGSQGAIGLDGEHLLAVNAGSDSISLFSIERDGDLELDDVESSGGDMPISVTVHDELVYVLNAGAPENISAFLVDDDDLSPLAGSTRSLSGSGVGPAQVSFSPNGKLLIVTEKNTNQIDTFVVGRDGLASGPNVQPSVGQTPFGFGFGKRGTLIVSEAFGGAPDASAVSSYHASRSGSLDPVTESALTTETAACWIALSPNGRFAYSTNTGSSTVTGFRVTRNGTLTILDSDGVTGQTAAGSSPIDAAFAYDGHGDDDDDRGGENNLLYVLSAGTNTITTFQQHRNGSLTSLGSVGGLPDGTVGLAAR